jgi:hypothetical protein
VAAYFPKELKPGQQVDLYAVAAGGVGEKRQPAEPLALVEEFKATPQSN